MARILTVRADNQVLAKVGDFGGLVVGSKGYLTLHVTFNEAWAGRTRTAVFTLDNGEEHRRTLSGGSRCRVPDEAAACPLFKVRIVGTYKDSVVQTNNVTIIQRRH